MQGASAQVPLASCRSPGIHTVPESCAGFGCRDVDSFLQRSKLHSIVDHMIGPLVAVCKLDQPTWIYAYVASDLPQSQGNAKVT